jgi:phosphatidate cytidylyltransferase
VKELLVRTLTSALFVLLLAGAVVWHSYASALLFFLFTLFACQEYVRMMQQGPPPYPGRTLALIVGGSSFIGIGSYALWELTLPLKGLLLLVPIAFLFELPRKGPAPFQRSALSLFAPLFFGSAFASLLLIREHAEGGPYLLLGSLMLIWVHDAGAYLFGKWLGRHKLWPRISPGKSWEGSVSGALVCIGASWLFASFLPGWGTNELELAYRFGFPVCVIFLGTLGDLSISLLKRSLDLKDTGRIFPGHGGVLDRFDATLMSAPAFYFLMAALG